LALEVSYDTVLIDEGSIILSVEEYKMEGIPREIYVYLPSEKVLIEEWSEQHPEEMA
jgi:hypothetical protein